MPLSATVSGKLLVAARLGAREVAESRVRNQVAVTGEGGGKITVTAWEGAMDSGTVKPAPAGSLLDLLRRHHLLLYPFTIVTAEQALSRAGRASFSALIIVAVTASKRMLLVQPWAVVGNRSTDQRMEDA